MTRRALSICFILWCAALFIVLSASITHAQSVVTNNGIFPLNLNGVTIGDITVDVPATVCPACPPTNCPACPICPTCTNAVTISYPLGPTNLTISAITSNSMLLSWISPATNAYVAIEVRELDFIWAILPPTATNYLATGLLPETTYSWTVAAEFAGSNSTSIATTSNSPEPTFTLQLIGGSATNGWLADSSYATGGSINTQPGTVNTSAVTNGPPHWNTQRNGTFTATFPSPPTPAGRP
jgi:hypothetical protein